MQFFRRRDHQRERAFGDGFPGIFRHVDHRNATVDRGDADAEFDDTLKPPGRADGARGNRPVARQDEAGAARRAERTVFRRILRRQDEIVTGLPEFRVDDDGHVRFAVGANDFQGPPAHSTIAVSTIPRARSRSPGAIVSGGDNVSTQPCDILKLRPASRQR